MADDYNLVPQDEISKLKNQLENVTSGNEISTKDLYEAVQKLATIMNEMLEVFSAAAEQMKLEDKDFESTSKKNDAIAAKLDRITDQNKTIAEGMVSMVSMIKEKLVAPKQREEQQLFRLRQEPKQPVKQQPMKQDTGQMDMRMQQTDMMMQQGMRPQPEMRQQPEWPTRQQQEPFMPRQQFTPQGPQYVASPPISPLPPPEFGMQLPPLQPTSTQDLDFPEEQFPHLGEEPKKKGLLGSDVGKPGGGPGVRPV